jgi:hypothetical protein
MPAYFEYSIYDPSVYSPILCVSFYAGYWSSSPMSAEVAGGHPYFLSCYFWFIYCIKFRDFTWYKWNTRSFVLILPTMWISCSWWIWQDSSSLIWVQKTSVGWLLDLLLPLSLANHSFLWSSVVFYDLFLRLDQLLSWSCHHNTPLQRLV